MDISKFKLKRVNPFQGLVIDAETWQDAHNYHRQQQKLHVLSLHQSGIVSGLEVTANNPPDTSINISPGMAIDPEGDVIIMPQQQRYRLQTKEKGLIYLVIQFREIPEGPYQPPDGGQPTRIMEAYRLQERDQLPSEPYIELARIDFDPAQGSIKDSRNQGKPAVNEINLNSRKEAKKSAVEKIVVQAPEKVVSQTPEKVVTPPAEKVSVKETLTFGHLVLGDADKNMHRNGFRNLINTFNRQGNYAAAFEEDIKLNKSLNRYSVIYVTGKSRFEINSEQQSAMAEFLQSGGLIFGDGCSNAKEGTESKGAREFGLAFNSLANQLNCRLEMVQRGHPILSEYNIFSEIPQGCESAMLLEGGNIVYSGGDYGCAWEGGYPDKPLARDVIRSAFEIGLNILYHSKKIKQ